MGYFKNLFMRHLPLWAEGCGTFLLVLIGTSVLTALGVAGQATTGSVILVATLGFGLSLGCLAWLFGPISGGHFNPAVSTLELLRDRISWLTWLQYLGAQCIGALLASVIVALLYGTPGVEAGLGVPSPMTVMGPLAALAAETLGTAVLLMAVVAATNSSVSRSAAAAIVAIALSLGMLFSLGISGGSLNPARSLAPQLVAANMTYWWVYILGPLVAAVIVGGLTKVMHLSLSKTQPDPSLNLPSIVQPASTVAEDNLALQHKAQQAANQLRTQQAIDASMEWEDVVEPTSTTLSVASADPLQPSFGGLIEEEPEAITYAEIVNQADARTESDNPQLMANLNFDPQASSPTSPTPVEPVATNGAAKVPQVKFVEFSPADDGSDD